VLSQQSASPGVRVWLGWLNPVITSRPFGISTRFGHSPASSTTTH
jgi:hypothetical protein